MDHSVPGNVLTALIVFGDYLFCEVSVRVIVFRRYRLNGLAIGPIAGGGLKSAGVIPGWVGKDVAVLQFAVGTDGSHFDDSS